MKNSAAPTEETRASGDDDAPTAAYWGVAPGEPLPILWEDLMPEGYWEDLIAQQEEFLATVEQRYAANATTLADARSFDEIEEGSALDYMPQFGGFEVVEELDGQLIRIPGYVVPFDFRSNQQLKEFLLVPYMGACIHTPPPPPNQIIFVRAEADVRVDDIWTPYWLEGTLSAEKNLNDVANAAYTLTLDHLKNYEVLGGAP